MHIILDLVPGHTSVECKWFKESMKPEKNEYSDRYIWTDNIWADCAGYPNISGSIRGISARNGSCAVNFFSTQPALNYGFAKVTESWQFSVDSKEAMKTREELYKIIHFWLQMGCDGFRVDMAGSLVKADEEKRETIKLWQDILGRINREFPDAAFVSEWGEPDKSLEGGFDMDFLLHFGPSHYPELFRGETPYFSHKGEGDLSEFFEYYISRLKMLYGVMGMKITENSISFSPCVPYSLYNISVEGLTLGGSMVDILITGSGSEIEKVVLNGRETEFAVIERNTECCRIEIFLKG